MSALHQLTKITDKLTKITDLSIYLSIYLLPLAFNTEVLEEK